MVDKVTMVSTTQRHTVKILAAMGKLPQPLTHKADATVRVSPTVEITQFSDGTFVLSLHETDVVSRSKGLTTVDHGGFKTGTSMVWILSALEALGVDATGSRAKGSFSVNGQVITGPTLLA